MAEAGAKGEALRRPLRFRAEALAARAVFGLFRALPLGAASAAGGAVARAIGPRLPQSNRARANLRLVMPELGEAAVEAIVRGMWDNLGRIAGEMAHLDHFFLAQTADRPGAIEVTGAEHLKGLGRDGRPVLIAGGHIGNWELQSLTVRLLGVELHVVYRAANNPLVDRMIDDMRGVLAAGTVPKGSAGARRMIALLKAGEAIGMLVDQKMNDGIAVPFFGRQAMTAPALAQLALRFRVPVVPVRCERLGGARFRVSFLPPLARPESGDRAADIAALTAEVNRLMEDWIRERPAQWLWLHRRWPKN